VSFTSASSRSPRMAGSIDSRDDRSLTVQLDDPRTHDTVDAAAAPRLARWMRIAAALRAELDDGRLAPGSRLPNE
jgi:hypothetical protein